MQTVLESLEQAYINTLNILNEANRDDNIGNYVCEEAVCAISELTKAIVLTVLYNDVCPSDKRVYVDITENNNTFATTDENTKTAFLNALYDNEILIREKTVGDLIEELKRFAPSLKVSICGNDNRDNKIVVDDTYLDKVVLVGVEQ